MAVLSINMIVTIVLVVLRLFVLSNDHLWCVDLCTLLKVHFSAINIYCTVLLSIQMMGK